MSIECTVTVILVHGDGAEPALPEMPIALAARLDNAGIGAMDPRQRADCRAANMLVSFAIV